jgi:predicted nucleic acid-binding protein
MKRAPAGRILVDTGPLVAILSSADAHHRSCVEALREMAAPLFSCWPVLTEAAWLLRRSPRAIQQLLASIDSGFLELLPLAGAEAKSIAAVMKKYESIRPQLADAALVYLAARERIDNIFTLDRRDFLIYRTGRRRAFRILPNSD